MNQKQLKQKIEKDEIDNFYIFCGEDYFLKRIYITRIAERKNLKIKKIFLENEDEIENLKIKLQSKDLFNRDKYLIYCWLNFKLTNISHLHIPKSTENIVVFDLLECTKDMDNVVHFKTPTREEISKFIKLSAKSNNKTIEKKAVDFLAEAFLDKNTTYLNNTLKVIFLYCANKKTITSEDTKKCLNINLKPKINIIFSLLRKNDLNKLKNMTEEILKEFAAPLFIHLMATELEKTFAACFLNEKDFEKFFKVYSSQYTKLCQKIGQKKLKNMLKDLYQLDKITKSSSPDNIDILIKTKLSIWSSQLQ